MKHIAAYAMLVLGGKPNPTAEDVIELIKEAGVKAEREQVVSMIAAVDGKSFNEIVALGMAKIAQAGPAVVAEAEVAVVAQAKVEVVEEEEEEVDMGGMFGDDEEY